jgi:H/ACA ribonucleoprotein complex subunit 2
VIAGNISPIDVITHVPILCEEANIPYLYVSSKEVSLSPYCLGLLIP